jgi:hypothetical protein
MLKVDELQFTPSLELIFLIGFFHQTSADYMFGGITIVCGIVGTLAGGITLDKIGSTIPNAFKVRTYLYYICSLIFSLQDNTVEMHVCYFHDQIICVCFSSELSCKLTFSTALSCG